MLTSKNHMPLFTRYRNSDVGQRFVCLFYENSDVRPLPCGSDFDSFEQLIEHLETTHNLSLRKNVDFCVSCEVLFHEKSISLEHWLSHSVNLSQFSLALQVEEESFLSDMFDKLTDIRKELMDYIFSKAIANDDAEKVAEVLEED